MMLLIFAFMAFPFFATVYAQSIQASNDSVPAQASQLLLTYSSTGGVSAQTDIQPLTPQIGLGQSSTNLNTILIKGTIRLADPHVAGSVAALTNDSIAYISCDLNLNSSMISPTDMVNQVINTPQLLVQAILLFSTTASHCDLIGEFSYTTMLSMTSIEASTMLRNIVTGSGSTLPSGTIMDETVASQNANNGTSGGSSGSSSTNQTPTPTTAVAMSILYSITGIITLLFLVIIATGAIRAHRHPERYGPRGGFPGRPRQSRAKGLARAMLETLPIVKFGDQEPVKPEGQDIELEQGANGAQHSTTEGADTTPKPDGASQDPEITQAEGISDAGIGPNTRNSERARSEHSDQGGSHLGCSICTEDFEKGEDVRVLPCNHKFHPACIDPWLLNVSGTCPLCRIDLRPAETQNSEHDEEHEADAAEAPPLAEQEGAEASMSQPRSRVSRSIDAALLRSAPAHQRIAILRQMRQEQLRNGTNLDHGTEDQSRRASLTARLRDAFRIRTRSVAEPSSTPGIDPPTTTTTPRVVPATSGGNVEVTLYGVFDGQTLRRVSTARQEIERASAAGVSLRRPSAV